MRFAHLSDMHLLERTDRRRFDVRFVSLGRRLDAADRLAKARAAIEHARAAGADHLLFTGDLTETGTLAQFEVLAELLADCNLRDDEVTLLPGNHDAYTSPIGLGRGARRAAPSVVARCCARARQGRRLRRRVRAPRRRDVSPTRHALRGALLRRDRVRARVAPRRSRSRALTRRDRDSSSAASAPGAVALDRRAARRKTFARARRERVERHGRTRASAQGPAIERTASRASCVRRRRSTVRCPSSSVSPARAARSSRDVAYAASR